MNYKRIYVVGVAGSGKNWFSERLSEKLNIPYYDLDDIAWVKKYTASRDRKEKIKMVKDLVKKKKWIICGCGNSYIGNLAEKADLIVILSIGLMKSTYRIYKRCFIRKMNGQADSFSNLIKAHKAHLKNNKKGGYFYEYLKSLEEKYPKKVLVLNQKEKRKFLDEVR